MGLFHSPSIVTDGLVLALDAANTKSYPGSGTTWFDISGNGNNGTLVNGPTYSSDNNGSIVFDGSNDRVDFAGVLSGFENDFTVETIVYRIGNGTNYPRLFLNATVNSSITITQYSTGTGILFRLQSNSTWYEYNLPTGTLVNNQWVYLSFSYDGSIMRAYINGAEYGSGSVKNVSVNTATSGIANIGGDSSTSSLDGRIGFTRVYSRALSDAEVAQNFEALRGRFGL